MTEQELPVWQALNDDETEELSSYCGGCELRWCQAGDDKCLLPYTYAKHGRDVWRIKVRTTDRWVVTFPRSGTTWAQELVWLINNDLDYEEAAKKRIGERYFFPEYIGDENQAGGSDADSSEMEKLMVMRNEDLPGKNTDSTGLPRFFKTHLPFDLLPPALLETGCKVVYVARNPKDVIVSYYYLHTSRNFLKYTGDFASFWDFFRRHRLLWCPYWAHVKKAWSLRHHPNLLFLFYEEMKMDLPGVIKRASEFYGRPCTDNEVTKLACHLDFAAFKKNLMIGASRTANQDLVSKDIFVRKGQIGGWKELFTPELEAQADNWIEENLRDTDLVFPHVQLFTEKG